MLKVEYSEERLSPNSRRWRKGVREHVVEVYITSTRCQVSLARNLSADNITKIADGDVILGVDNFNPKDGRYFMTIWCGTRRLPAVWKLVRMVREIHDNMARISIIIRKIEAAQKKMAEAAFKLSSFPAMETGKRAWTDAKKSFTLQSRSIEALNCELRECVAFLEEHPDVYTGRIREILMNEKFLIKAAEEAAYEDLTRGKTSEYQIDLWHYHIKR